MKKSLMFHIVVPTFNRAHLLPRAIDSVLSQNHDNYHIYIIDDGSTDNTSDICKKYIEKYPEKISYFHKKNGGVGSARNVGIEAALKKSLDLYNDWIFFLDSDDELLQESFLNIDKITKKYDGYGMYLFDAIDENHNLYFTINEEIEIVDYKRWLNGFSECGFCVKLDCFLNKKFRFETGINGGESILWNRMFQRKESFGIFVKGYPIRKYYTNTESLCRVSKRDEKWLDNAYKINSMSLDFFGQDYKKFAPKVYGELLLMHSQLLSYRGKKRISVYYFFKGLVYHKKLKSIILYILSLLDYKFLLTNLILLKLNKYEK